MSDLAPARFPDTFEWGTATAAHQIEGGNWNNDWWRWEHTPGSPCSEPSGDACDSWNRWIEDVGLVADLGFDNYRFSIEWSRIEPEDGLFSTVAIDHYRRLCDVLRERQVQPVVTFHHFTTPRWVADQGGWENPANVDRFARFCEWAARRLHGLMGRACTINEPNVVAFAGYGAGFFPPGVRDRDRARRVHQNFIAAHRAAVAAIREGAPEVPVGMTLSMSEHLAVDGGESRLDRIRRTMEDQYLEATVGDDYVGVQTYSRTRVGPDGVLGPEPGVPVLPMGYEYWPQSLAATIRRAWEVTNGSVPIRVTENGIGTDDDTQRVSYLRDALAGVLDTIAEGIDVRGYTCWSLLDNFEWAYGYRPKFGLVAVDRDTFVRTPKPSAYWLRDVARANALPDG
jgi:beta-glucosidase